MSDVPHYIFSGLRMIQTKVTDCSKALVYSTCFAVFMNWSNS